jgi:hypothetical protein
VKAAVDFTTTIAKGAKITEWDKPKGSGIFSRRKMPALRFERPRKAETGHDSKHHLSV